MPARRRHTVVMTDVPSPDPAGPGVTGAADPGAAELAQLDRDIAVLTVSIEQARQAWTAMAQQLDTAHQRRYVLAGQLAARAAKAPPPSQQAAEHPRPVPAEAEGEPAGPVSRPETSAKTVQNGLFVLGGLLLSSAAVVFTAVAWDAYGVAGRAAILSVVTLIALAIPGVALWRRLRATAETFALVGMLLVVLDGYAAWYVNLFGVNDLPANRYAALVCTVTALVAAGYGRLTRLGGPFFVAIGMAQPVLPLLVAGSGLDVAAWSMMMAAVALANLGLVWRNGVQRQGLQRQGVQRQGVQRHDQRRAPPNGTVADGPRLAYQVVGWVFAGAAWLASGLAALAALVTAHSAAAAGLAWLASVLAAAVLTVASALTRSSAFHNLAGAVVVLAAVVGGATFVAVTWPSLTLVLVAATVALAAVLAWAASSVLAPTAKPGPPAGAILAAAVLVLVLLADTATVAVETVVHALALWDATITTTAATRFDWQLLAGVGLAATALIAAPRGLPRAATPSRATRFGGTWTWAVLVAAATTATLALPGCVALAWWVPSAMDIAVAAVLAVLAATLSSTGATRTSREPTAREPTAWVLGVAVTVLTGHGVLASLARPENTAAVLAAVVVVGLGVATLALRDKAAPARRAIAGFATTAAFLACPPAVGAAAVAVDLMPWWVARLSTASVLVVLAGLVAVRRAWPELTWYAFVATLSSAALWPIVGAVSGVEPTGVYAGTGLLLIAASLLPMRDPAASDTTTSDPAALDPPALDPPALDPPALDPPALQPPTLVRAAGNTPTAAVTIASVAALPAALLFAADVLPVVLAVVGLPYTWLDAIWSGPPGGPGLTPSNVAGFGDLVETGATQAVALGLLALASSTAIYAIRRRVWPAVGGLGIGGPTAIIVALLAAQAPWPTIPAVTLLLGLVILVVVALVPIGQWRTTVGTTQALAYVGAGLAGTLTTKWSTVAGLSFLVVGAAIVGSAGRTAAWRVSGWLTAVAAALATAAATGLAAGLPVRGAAFAVLAVAAVSLLAAPALRQRGAAETAAVQAVAHAGAVVAVLMATDSWGASATVSTLWGLAVGLRALWPGTSRSDRAALAALAAAWELLAWWLLLADRDVTLIEAYTLPFAAVALLAGWAALRARPDLHSWASYGPALAAAFLPSLALILGDESGGSPWRRLLLGSGALLVVVGGSVRRRQAPVVLGGVVVGIVALHEVAVYWEHVPRWIPLALGGLLLVVLAITYERRRRDLAWLRHTVGRMH